MKILEGEMNERYSCFQGHYGKCWCPNLWRKCPCCGLILEVLICPGWSVNGNRHEIQKVYPVTDTKLETCMILGVTIGGFLGLIGQPFIGWFTACLLAQQEHEFTLRKGGGGKQPEPDDKKDTKEEKDDKKEEKDKSDKSE